MLRYLFVEEYSIPVPSDRKSTCLCTCSFSDSYPDNMISEHDFLKRSCLAQPDWRAKRVHDRFICKHGRRLFRNHSPWLVLDCSTPLMAIFNRA